MAKRKRGEWIHGVARGREVGKGDEGKKSIKEKKKMGNGGKGGFGGEFSLTAEAYSGKVSR